MSALSTLQTDGVELVRRQSAVHSIKTIGTILVAILVLSAGALAQRREKILHNFNNTNGTDGYLPEAGLVLDSAGNLYGTTDAGGLREGGTVFELSPEKSGGWFERILFNFAAQTPGDLPRASLILDGAGNLYGTTYQGGTHAGGVAFRLTRETGSGWKEKILCDFGGFFDGTMNGSRPSASLVFDPNGKLYSTTRAGGPHAYGTVFELSPNSDETWTESVLHFFVGHPTDGFTPIGNVVFDSAGNLYGTTRNGGAYSYGNIFELSPVGDGTWTETVLYNFAKDSKNNPVGSEPGGGLIVDASGNLYGTTSGGGANGGGTLFELSPSNGGSWSVKVLHRFGKGVDGIEPTGGLVADVSGNLYGVTSRGGPYSSGTVYGGTVFKLSPVGNGSWTETILHNFGKGTDGGAPVGGLIFDSLGNLYGTTFGGGLYGAGVVFEITP
jgi:uncharacterized repeat protein (TIGR03803 family)